MALYTYLPVKFDLYPWFQNGDIPGDGVVNGLNNGAIVRRHSTYGNYTGKQQCPNCGYQMDRHGVLMKPVDLKKNVVVCPGSFLQKVTDTKGKVLGYNILSRKFVETHLMLVPEETK